MKALTKAQCEKFHADRTVNPLTGRRIQAGKAVYNSIMKRCEELMPKDVPVVEQNPPQTTTKKNKIIKPTRPPPMGPMMHWRIDARGERDFFNNMIKIGNHIKNRIRSFGEDEVLSKMEIEEFREFLKEYKAMFKGKAKYEAFHDDISNKISELRQTHKMYDDRPKYKIIDDREVSPSRHFNRERVCFLYDVVNRTMSSMKECLLQGKIEIYVSSSQYENTMDIKTYMDYLIAHKIFTHDDIYKHTFKSDKIFDELTSTWKEYQALYKKEKGKSP